MSVRDAQALLVRWRRARAVTSEPAGWSERDVDGIAGPRTRAAVARFQRVWNAHGHELQLVAGGAIDADTLAALRVDLLLVLYARRRSPDAARELRELVAELAALAADIDPPTTVP